MASKISSVSVGAGAVAAGAQPVALEEQWTAQVLSGNAAAVLAPGPTQSQAFEWVGDGALRQLDYPVALQAYRAALEGLPEQAPRVAVLRQKIAECEQNQAGKIAESSTWQAYDGGVVTRSTETTPKDHPRTVVDVLVSFMERVANKLQRGNTGYAHMGQLFGPMANGGSRIRLFEHNLYSADLDKHEPAEKGGGILKFSRTPPPADEDAASCTASRYRTATGACYFDKSNMGAAGTLLGTNTNPKDVVAGQAVRRPNPFEVSEALLLSPPGAAREHAVDFSNLATAWSQFLVHDLEQHTPRSPKSAQACVDETSPGYFSTERLTTHPLKDYAGPHCIPQVDTDPAAGASKNPSARINEVTHWWDASQLYGSDAATVRKLRSNPDGTLVPGGKLRLDEHGLLPVDQRGLEITGNTSNWWAGLNVLHTVFAQEHNRICDMLKAKHPDFDDEKIYQTARLINAAFIAKTHTVEWTPLLLGGPVQAKGMAANGYGLISGLFQGVRMAPDGKTLTNTGKANVLDHVPDWLRNSSLFGLYGAHQEMDGVPYAMTEEFGLAYRALHAALEDQFVLKQADGTEKPLGVNALRGAHVHELMGTPDDAARVTQMFGSSPSPTQTLHNYPRLFGAVQLPGLGPQDLAAMDLDSARKDNLPDYLTLRKRLNMDEGATPTWESLFGAHAEEMKRVYGDLNNIDPVVGMLAERERSPGSVISETQFRIFTIMASRRILADPFYTERYTPEYYTQEGLDWVSHRTMRTALLDTYPQLKDAGIPDNAFKTWGAAGQAKAK